MLRRNRRANALTVTAAALAAMLATACRSTPKPAELMTAASFEPSADLLALAGGLTGHFSSAGQADRDEDFLHIELRAVRIFPEREDGIWLYVEQAAGWTLDRPYRQRFYRLTEPAADGHFVSEVYLLPGDDPLALAGAWADLTRFEGLDPMDARLRDGCAIYLTRNDRGDFEGRTDGNSCPSELGDAVYATSAVTISDDFLLSWDRGWTQRGIQAWGAETGPYLFERQTP